MDLRDHAPPTVVIPLERWDRMARRAMHVAACLSPDVMALHLTDLEGPDAEEHEPGCARNGRSSWSGRPRRPDCPRHVCSLRRRPTAACSRRCCGRSKACGGAAQGGPLSWC